MYRILILFSCLLCFSCNYHNKKNDKFDNNTQNKTQKSIRYKNYNFKQLNTPGLVRIDTYILETKYPNDTVYLIVNNDTVDFICRDETQMEFANFKKNSKIDIWCYDPEYHLIIFEGFDKVDKSYKVMYNGQWAYLTYLPEVTIYETWETHLQICSFLTSEDNPLRIYPNDASPKIEMDYRYSSFIYEKLDGDWIYVSCDINCEGCPNGKVVSGWLRWRKDDTLLVDIRYLC
ncbi:MAG TPA: hypothetical protein PK626_07305 [Bacteroidales bacterium]|jgi:hypothetical protein|nr:hypothetical protein [Bacteroidales bacterium]